MSTLTSVLIVDDEPAVRDLMARWVTSLGLHARTAASADEALATLRTQQCDMAVIDVMMPGHDGLWLANELQRDHPQHRRRHRHRVHRADRRRWRRSADRRSADQAVSARSLRAGRGPRPPAGGRRRSRSCSGTRSCRSSCRTASSRSAPRSQRRAMPGARRAGRRCSRWRATQTPQVAAHGERVARYAAVGRARDGRRPTSSAASLEVAARFHDIGKLAMPDALLTKPSPLTPGEDGDHAAARRGRAPTSSRRPARSPTSAPARPRLTRMVRRRRLSAEARRASDSARQPHHRGRRRLRRDDPGPRLSRASRFGRRGRRAPALQPIAVRPGDRRRVPRRPRPPLIRNRPPSPPIRPLDGTGPSHNRTLFRPARQHCLADKSLLYNDLPSPICVVRRLPLRKC